MATLSTFLDVHEVFPHVLQTLGSYPGSRLNIPMYVPVNAYLNP